MIILIIVGVLQGVFFTLFVTKFVELLLGKHDESLGNLSYFEQIAWLAAILFSISIYFGIALAWINFAASGQAVELFSMQWLKGFFSGFFLSLLIYGIQRRSTQKTGPESN